jgi:hypothetical protein
MLDELKAQITAAIADVTKNMLQHFWQEVDYRWDVCRPTDGTHCEVFCTATFRLVCKKAVSVDE